MRYRLLSSAIIWILAFPLCLSSQDYPDKQSITGSWIGRIEVSAISLRIVFNLSVIGSDSLVATMDSPDQGVKNIKLGPVTLAGDNINISAGAMLAEYNGTIKNDTLIEGTWSQAGKTFPMNITRLKALFTLNRPQEPRPPYPYISEDITFTNDKFNIRLAGTLTLPRGTGPFPAVILITGSGSQNRDEEILGHKPFLVIADHLTRNGIAVLRYDDRGIGMSQGTPFNSTSADFATDAEAAFYYLKTRPEINPGRIGLAGHSEGGMIAPIVASANPDVAFIVSLAGPGVTGEKLLHRQNRDISSRMGLDEKQIKDNIATNKKLFAVIKKVTDNDKAEEKAMATYRKILTKRKVPAEEVEKNVSELRVSFGNSSYTWLRYFMITDPATFWKKVRCPVLALNGENDLQVAADLNLAAISKALMAGGNRDVTTVRLPGLNHLFQESETGLPSEYGEIEETFSPDVLKIMTDWILGLN
jgi:hypothetical protein